MKQKKHQVFRSMVILFSTRLPDGGSTDSVQSRRCNTRDCQCVKREASSKAREATLESTRTMKTELLRKAVKEQCHPQRGKRWWNRLNVLTKQRRPRHATATRSRLRGVSSLARIATKELTPTEVLHVSPATPAFWASAVFWTFNLRVGDVHA